MDLSLSRPALPGWHVDMLEWWCQARENAEMSQDRVLAALSMGSEELELIESGAVLPSLDTLQRFANTTGTSLKVRLDPREGEPIGPFSRLLRELGIQIACHRVVERLSHDELALRCGVAAEILSQIEEGEFAPRHEDVWLIARSFNVSIGDLLTSVEMVLDTRSRPR